MAGGKPIEGFSKENKIKTKYFIAMAGVGTLVYFCLFGLEKISDKFCNKFESKKFEVEKYRNRIDSTYKSIVNENVDDTSFVNLLNKYVPFSEKEKIVKQNNLEEKTLGKEILIEAE